MSSDEELLGFQLREPGQGPFSVDDAIWPMRRRDPLNGLEVEPEPPPADGAVVIALTVLGEAAALRGRHKIDAPSAGLAGFVFLGFDVADAWLVSGLTRCGLRYDGELNAAGLLATVEAAHRLRERCDKDVREHCPFYVYGLWRKAD